MNYGRWFQQLQEVISLFTEADYSQLTPVGPLHAEKIGEAVFLSVFKTAFTTSIFWKGVLGNILFVNTWLCIPANNSCFLWQHISHQPEPVTTATSPEH